MLSVRGVDDITEALWKRGERRHGVAAASGDLPAHRSLVLLEPDRGQRAAINASNQACCRHVVWQTDFGSLPLRGLSSPSPWLGMAARGTTRWEYEWIWYATMSSSISRRKGRGEDADCDCPTERADQTMSDRHVVWPVRVIARVLVNDLHVLATAEHKAAEEHIECLNRQDVRSKRHLWCPQPTP